MVLVPIIACARTHAYLSPELVIIAAALRRVRCNSLPTIYDNRNSIHIHMMSAFGQVVGTAHRHYGYDYTADEAGVRHRLDRHNTNTTARMCINAN